MLAHSGSNIPEHSRTFQNPTFQKPTFRKPAFQKPTFPKPTLQKQHSRTFQNISESVTNIPEAACPWASGSLDRMKEEISSHLQAEIQSGFANLLVQLTSEIQKLSSDRSVMQHFLSHRNTQTISQNQPEDGSDRTLRSISCQADHGLAEPFSATNTYVLRKSAYDLDVTASKDFLSGTDKEDSVSRLPAEECSVSSSAATSRKSLDSTLSADSEQLPRWNSLSVCKTQARAQSRSSLSLLLQQLKISKKADRSSARHTVEHMISKPSSTFSSLLEQWIANRNQILKDADKTPKNCLVRLVDSNFFAVLSMAMIAVNSCWLGFECDYLIGHPADSREGWIEEVDIFFSIWFIVELILRLVALRKLFIFGNDWVWNLLDVGLVLLSILTLVASGMNVAIFRFVRLLKLSRALRLVRLARFFTDLREILVSIFFTLNSLFWCFVTLALTTYLFAIVFLQWRLYKVEEGAQYSKEITDKFKNTWETMLLLFSMISGGQDWYEIAQVFDKNSDYGSKLWLLCYIFVVSFGVLNVIIGVFCAKANEASSNDEVLRVKREEDQTKKRITDLIEVFYEMNAGKEARVSEKQVKRYFTEEKSKWILQSLGLEVVEGSNLWRLLSYDDGCEGSARFLDLPSFVMGMMRLSGSARNMELVMLSKEIEHLQIALGHVKRVLK